MAISHPTLSMQVNSKVQTHAHTNTKAASFDKEKKKLCLTWLTNRLTKPVGELTPDQCKVETGNSLQTDKLMLIYP